MKSGYKVLWTDHALEELASTVAYLELNFTDREIKNLANKIETTLRLISTNPEIFPEYEVDSGIRRVVVAKHNTLYYRLNGTNLEIMSFFSNRQDPAKRKL